MGYETTSIPSTSLLPHPSSFRRCYLVHEEDGGGHESKHHASAEAGDTGSTSETVALDLLRVHATVERRAGALIDEILALGFARDALPTFLHSSIFIVVVPVDGSQ